LVEIDNFFSEVKRVLKKGGRLIISTENLASYHNIFALLLGNQPYSGPYLSQKHPIGHRLVKDYWDSPVSSKMSPHLNVMTTKSLASLLNYNKFKIKKVQGVGFYPLPIPFSDMLAKICRYHASYCVVSSSK